MSGLISAGPLLRCHVPGIRYRELQTIVNTDQLWRARVISWVKGTLFHSSPYIYIYISFFSPEQITFHPRSTTPRSSVILPFFSRTIDDPFVVTSFFLSFIFAAIFEARYTFQREASKFRLAAKRLSPRRVSRVNRFDPFPLMLLLLSIIFVLYCIYRFLISRMGFPSTQNLSRNFAISMKNVI